MAAQNRRRRAQGDRRLSRDVTVDGRPRDVHLAGPPMTLRGCLDALYNAAARLAGLFMVGTLAMVVTGIAGRLLGFHVPGTDAYAGYCMAGAGFLALAH